MSNVDFTNCFHNSDLNKMLEAAVPIAESLIGIKKSPIYTSRFGGPYFDAAYGRMPRINMGPCWPLSGLDTLCHELIHLRDWEQGRLRWIMIDDKHAVEYDGVKYPDTFKMIRESDRTPRYTSLPWEVEPYKLMCVFAQQVADELKVEYTVVPYDWGGNHLVIHVDKLGERKMWWGSSLLKSPTIINPDIIS